MYLNGDISEVERYYEMYYYVLVFNSQI